MLKKLNKDRGSVTIAYLDKINLSRQKCQESIYITINIERGMNYVIL